MKLKDNLLRGIYAYGFEEPSEIQKKAILPIIQKEMLLHRLNLVLKNWLILYKFIERVDTSKDYTQIIILATTHELALQIYKVLTSLDFIDGLVVKTLIGGTSSSRRHKKIYNKTLILLLELLDALVI